MFQNSCERFALVGKRKKIKHNSLNIKQNIHHRKNNTIFPCQFQNLHYLCTRKTKVPAA